MFAKTKINKSGTDKGMLALFWNILMWFWWSLLSFYLILGRNRNCNHHVNGWRNYLCHDCHLRWCYQLAFLSQKILTNKVFGLKCLWNEMSQTAHYKISKYLLCKCSRELTNGDTKGKGCKTKVSLILYGKSLYSFILDLFQLYTTHILCHKDKLYNHVSYALHNSLHLLN